MATVHDASIALLRRGARQAAGIVSGGLQDLPLPEPGLVRFRAVSVAALGLVAELNGQVQAAGYPQHEIVAREGRIGLTHYTGREPLTLTIPLLFDRWQARGSVEPELRVLDLLYGLDGDDNEPPVIVVEGFGIPHSYTRDPSLRFELSGDPQWGDDGRTRNGATDGNLSFQSVTVVARQVMRPTAITAPPATAAARHTITVQKGSKLNTLRAIARHRHLDWRHLRALNPRLSGDPDHALKAGTKVRVS